MANLLTVSAKRNNNFPVGLMIGLGFSFLFLACDDGGYAPQIACVVAPDPIINGRAYAQIETFFYSRDRAVCSEAHTDKNDIPVVFETDDYGQNWYKLDNPPAEWKHWHYPQNTLGLTASDGRLWLNGKAVYSITRSQLASFFPNTVDPLANDDNLMGSSAPPGQGVLYVAMGQYGVLVGPNPMEAAKRDWQWNINIVSLRSLAPFTPLVVNDLAGIIKIVLFFLAIPPVPWIEAWLLAQVWRYMFPEDEAYKARRLGRSVAVGTTVIYAIAIVFWLLNADSDFYAVVGFAAIVTTIGSIVTSVSVARKRQFTDAFVWRLGIATTLLSLIVPVTLLLSTNQAVWPSILALILGFSIYRRAITRYVEGFEARTTFWQVDRLSLEIMVLLLLIFGPLLLIIANTFQGGTVLLLILILMTSLPFIVAAWAARLYTRWRGHSFSIKKKSSPLELHDTPLFADRKWFETLIFQTAVWAVGAIGIGVVVWTVQTILVNGWEDWIVILFRLVFPIVS